MRPRLSFADYLHRTFVTGLAGLGVYGVVMGVLIHRETLQKGRGLLAQKEAEGITVVSPQAKEEERELDLASRAQAALQVRRP
ncbi:hypothetical protein PLICRDRAFT_34454 [Plicaturopsis crispa FD-325 SS-3]|nr:hypothetical protein PLICRDRAFT_34454 [Plicaturopsis crispa FD-325 SS-3]